ncbi:hypothetical protein [Sphingobium sp. HWE2-09]|uniref:hypothetical protein n=1 Tax=Sphingobium sp. HWE2-09 TaxID=3108390 RepID=UPI002DC8589D|nr:hypothetical protein [Sphingobium sp. HWE2-09]
MPRSSRHYRNGSIKTPVLAGIQLSRREIYRLQRRRLLEWAECRRHHGVRQFGAGPLGQPTQYASKWTGSASLDYARPVGSGKYQLGGGVSIFARSKFNAGAYSDLRMEQKGLGLIDAHADLSPVAGPWRLTVFSRNLTDKRYLDFALTPPAQATAVLGTYSRGRQIGMRLSVAVR